MKNLAVTKQVQMNELFPCERFNLYNFVYEYKIEKCLKSNNNLNLLNNKDIYNINYKGKSYYGKKRRYYTDYC
jgi:hypothetical protein